MKDKLRNFIESLFEDAPKNKQTIELKEEMLQNLIDKYNDLVDSGKSSEAAYNIATASIGDIHELIRQIEKREENNPLFEQNYDKGRKRFALLLSISVMLYILCVVPVILLEDSVLGVVIMFVMVAIATGLILYNNMTKPKYLKKDSTVVEEFKEWKANSTEKNTLYQSITKVMWSCITILYFIVSFLTMAWHITWIIFLIGSAIQGIIRAIFELKK
ncbi:MAG TPA: hypothetical protein DCR62_07290 [Acholeplasmatales bacterium]|jgi:hypothetical protein|nr:hypothetical protein [Staphylococcus sp.]CDC71616.1 putative membrane protein [Staphylococcus sp. CAG:324]HAR58533.1 hypothetical protein [Acholeplasmatales bacterium]